MFWFSVSLAPLLPAIPYAHTMTGSRPVFAFPERCSNTHICVSTLGHTEANPHSFAKSTHTLVNPFLLWSFTPKERTNLLLQRVQRCHTVFIWMGTNVCRNVCGNKWTQILVEREKFLGKYWSQHVVFGGFFVVSVCIFIFSLPIFLYLNSAGNLCRVYNIAYTRRLMPLQAFAPVQAAHVLARGTCYGVSEVFEVHYLRQWFNTSINPCYGTHCVGCLTK